MNRIRGGHRGRENSVSGARSRLNSIYFLPISPPPPPPLLESLFTVLREKLILARAIGIQKEIGTTHFLALKDVTMCKNLQFNVITSFQFNFNNSNTTKILKVFDETSQDGDSVQFFLSQFMLNNVRMLIFLAGSRLVIQRIPHNVWVFFPNLSLI